MMTLRNAAVHNRQPAHTITIAAQPLSLETFKQTSSGVSLYRLKQVLERIPVSRSAWFAGVQTGRYPRSYSLGPRTTVWRSDDIDRVIASVGAVHDGASTKFFRSNLAKEVRHAEASI